MYECESWTIKKAECWKIDAFELRCWRRLLRVPRTARRFNQSILKEISPGCSLEELMLKLKLQYFGHLMRRSVSFEKTLKLGKIEGRRRGLQRRDGWMASPTQWTWLWVDSGSWWWTGRPGVLWFMGSQRVGHDWVTELNIYIYIYIYTHTPICFVFQKTLTNKIYLSFLLVRHTLKEHSMGIFFSFHNWSRRVMENKWISYRIESKVILSNEVEN